MDKLAKFDDVLRVENEMKRVDPNFKGFYMDVPYLHKIRNMVEYRYHEIDAYRINWRVGNGKPY